MTERQEGKERNRGETGIKKGTETERGQRKRRGEKGLDRGTGTATERGVGGGVGHGVRD